MNRCPRGHLTSPESRFCEVCEHDRPAAFSAFETAWTCRRQQCRTTQKIGRFCEACGSPNPNHPDYDPQAAPRAQSPEPANPPARPVPTPATGSPALGEPAESGEPAKPGASGPEESVEATPPAWSVTVGGDHEFFALMQSHNGPDTPRLTLPADFPSRRHRLQTPRTFVGRRSRRRGILPEIDLAVEPEDPAVSHAHAAIVADGDGWSLVDVGSANGTYLNGAHEPEAVDSPVPLRPGDCIRLGAWTVLTVVDDSPTDA